MKNDVDPDALRFGLEVRRRYRGLMTKTEFAKQMRVSFGLVGYWEKGTRRPTDDRVERAAEVLKCKPGDLWAGWDDGARPGIGPRRTAPTDGDRIAALEAELALHRAALERAGWLERAEEATTAFEDAAE